MTAHLTLPGGSPNGAGKTTLFSMISGFLEPSEGRVFFEDQEITGLPPERVAARGLIRTFQLVQLFQNLTTLENVKIGKHLRTKAGLAAAVMRPGWARREEREVEQTARELLDFVGLSSQAETSASVLPYGQQRLLEIARALATGRTALCGGASRGRPAALSPRHPTHRLQAIGSARTIIVEGWAPGLGAGTGSLRAADHAPSGETSLTVGDSG